MSTATGLADLLFGRTRGAILALLYGHADQTFYTRQIAREVDASIGAVQREQALINKTIGVFSVLRSALQPLSKRIVVAFVYGSVAREEETAQSDVDLMVVGKATLHDVLSRLSTVEKGLGRPINPTVYSVAEFKSKLASGNHFLNSVLKGQKAFLLGDEDELREWVEYGWLRREPTSPGEIRDLLGIVGIVERSLADSRVAAIDRS